MNVRIAASIAMAALVAGTLPFMSGGAISQGLPKAPPAKASSHSGGGSGSHFWGGYVASSAVCSAAVPILGTIILNRELTPREAISSIVGCWTFGVGGLVVWETWNPEWDKLYATRRP